MFADDSNLFFADKKLDKLESTVNYELTKIKNWLHTNELSLNIDKSNLVIFHPPQKKGFPIKLSMNNQILSYKPYIKYLGILIDANFNWKHQVQEIKKKSV